MRTGRAARRAADGTPALRGVLSGPRPTVTSMRLLHTSDWHLGPVLPPGGPARGPGAVRRLPGRDRRSPSGSTRCWSPATSTTGRCPRSTPSRCSTTRSRRLARDRRPGRADQRQPRLGPPARLRRRADRRGRRPPAHRPAAGRRAGAAPQPDGSGAVAVYPIPYLEPDAVRADLLDDDCQGRGHAAVLDAAMSRVRADLAGRPGHPSVVLAHAFVAGGLASDSERDISVGGVSVVPTACLRRRRLRRARSSARRPAADRDGPLQRLAARLLVLRGAPAQGGAARRPGRRARASHCPVEALPDPGAPTARPGRGRPRRPADRRPLGRLQPTTTCR